jgi:hypothetical protein
MNKHEVARLEREYIRRLLRLSDEQLLAMLRRSRPFEPRFNQARLDLQEIRRRRLF